VRDEKSEVEHEDIKELVNEEIIGEVPDHKHVREGIALRKPVVSYKPDSRAAYAVKDVAHRIKGGEPPKRPLQKRLKMRLQDVSPI
jgi:MinD-like ATPase involved in chromosome partitioning or flagellar assembly